MLDELQAVIEETESAANRFMAAAEALDRLAADAGSGVESQIIALTGGIFEASAFRDITGQRLGKVMRQLHGLNGNGRGAKANVRRSQAQSQAGNPAHDARSLLSGPQLANAGCSQVDVDALLASFD